MKRFLGRAGLGLAAAATLTVTGCAAATGTDESEQTDPSVVLASSADALGDEPAAFEMTMGDVMTMTGVFDPANEAGEMTMSFDADGMQMEMQFVVIETDVWMNMGEIGQLMGAETPWMLIDLSRLGPDALGFEPGDSDLMGATEMLQSLGEVEQVDDHTFEGTIDLTATSNTMVDDDLLDLVGEDAANLAFTATIDDQDRLSTISIELPSIPGLGVETIDMRFFDYGSPVEITPPPADQVSEMPAELYGFLDL